MKITKIELKGYNQFKDVIIDLTYPRGHEKEGKPLDKICIIGQSGSGKTSLLRIIKWFVSLIRDIGENIEIPLPLENALKIDVQFFDLIYRMYNIEKFPYLLFDWNNKLDDEKFFELLNSYYSKINPLLINFPTEILTGNDRPEADETDSLVQMEKIRAAMAYPYQLQPQYIIDFAFDDVKKTWDYILKDIKEHQAQELLIKNRIAETAARKNVTFEEIEKKTKEHKKWLSKNPNPLKALAKQFLNPILFKLGLKTKTDIDLEAIRHLGFIQLQTLAGQDVPRSFWSTGTRQMVNTTTPLFQLKPKNAVILIDEPERSLYPDIQLNIIDTYVKLAPECQFFFATHSPIIASSFEPWEIVELKFDKENKYVYRELHYEGNNHVDNYKYYPEYLRWDSILSRIFDLEEEGGKKRLRSLEELAEIKAHLKALKKEGKLESFKGKELVKKFKLLSQKVDWEFE
jgi:AAA15 family ATPase/GTPase